MQLVHTIDEVRAQVKAWKQEGLSVGLVPTMGYLHDGHKSLIERAVKENDRVVVSDFVNPEEMYYKDNCTFVDMNRLTDVLCGKTRPIHFSGVCSVVTKLFHIVTPDRAYFGQKDAQQLAVIRRMVRDLNFDIEIVGCPIVREADGLAMSSRNTYLNEEERKAALVLSQAVRLGEELIEAGEKNAAVIKEKMIAHIEAEPLAKIDYVEIVDAQSLEPVPEIQGEILAAMAVYIGKTRLIDNFIR